MKIFQYSLSILLFVCPVQFALAVDLDFVATNSFSVTPQTNDKRAAVLTNIEIQITGNFDVNTLTNESIRLTAVNGYFRVKGRFHYAQEAKIVSFSPNKPLMHGQEYQLVISGLKMLSGTVYPDFRTQFTTLKIRC